MIDKSAAALKSGKTVSDILMDVEYASIHAFPRFRKLIQDHGTTNKATLVAKTEPGVPLHVKVRLIGKDGKPLTNAEVYCYHTSAKGWYSDKAAHISGNSGDYKFARLFAYVKTDSEGKFELTTIHPGGYPRSDLPQHIHVNAKSADGKSLLETEILFEGDPRLTKPARERAKQAGFVIGKVKKSADKIEQVEVELKFSV